MYLTNSQVEITVWAQGLDDPTPWQSAYGGEAKMVGRVATYTDLVLKRLHSTGTTEALAWYLTNLTHGVLVSIKHLDVDYRHTGTGLQYDGQITHVVPALWDANKSDHAMDRLTIKPVTVTAL